jgi:ankyrin repeat protein
MKRNIRDTYRESKLLVQDRLFCMDIPPSNKTFAVESPSEVAISLCKENGFDAVHVNFMNPNEEMIANFNKSIVSSLRTGNLEELRTLLSTGVSMNCCNRFGESLLHMACRRGSTDLVKFLVTEANVSLYIRDDFGRTVLHDACWTSSPNLELFEFLLTLVPEFVMIKDVRGHYPLDYVRKQHWDVWSSFLRSHKALLCSKTG